MERCDVAVVGAGLAGLECARRIAANGTSVALLDRRTRLDRGVRTTGIFVRRTLEDFALPQDCLGPAVRRVVLYAPSMAALSLHSPKDEFRVGRMARLYARRLDACERAGVRWLPGARYLRSEPSRHGSLLLFERNGIREALQARFLVGSDGAGSPVARDLGLERNRRFLLGLEEFYEGQSLGEPAFHCFLDPRFAPGYIAWLVDDGEAIHLGTAGSARGFEPHAALEGFKARLPEHLRPSSTPTERRGGRIPSGGVLRRIACPRGLLVGDAAGAVSPLTAGGLDACLRLSAFASGVTGDYLAAGDPRTLEPYSGERFRSRFASRLFMRRILETFGSPLLMEAAHAALRASPGRILARHVFFGRGSFPLPAPVREASPAT
jgi:flavin-dependent dehydrogenase